MNYLTITHNDMLNGDGLRVVLWVSGCSLHCEDCQNKYSWDFNEGILFDERAKEEIFSELKKDYIFYGTGTARDVIYNSYEVTCSAFCGFSALGKGFLLCLYIVCQSVQVLDVEGYAFELVLTEDFKGFKVVFAFVDDLAGLRVDAPVEAVIENSFYL